MNTMKQPSVADVLTRAIATCGKRQKAIAIDAGFKHPNFLTMLKQGTTKVPLKAAPRIAKAVGLDPRWFLQLCLAEYEPELLETIESTHGVVPTEHEAELLTELRAETGFSNPRLSTDEQLTALAGLARALVPVRSH